MGDAVTQWKTLFISDVHLGTRGCRASELLDFLKHNDAETIYLVGDIIDFWRVRRGAVWLQSHNGLGLGAEVTEPARQVAVLLGDRVARLPHARQPALTPARLFIITCVIEAAIRTAAYGGLPLFFGTQEFEDELVHAVRSFLAAPV